MFDESLIVRLESSPGLLRGHDPGRNNLSRDIPRGDGGG